MVQEEPQVLINFLYKDKGLASSFSAQLFSGLLKEVQKEIEGQDKANYKVGGKIPFLHTNLEASQLSKDITREIISPHDILYLDLLHKLTPYIKEDLSQANFGDLVAVEGNIFFFSSELIRLATEAFVTIIQHDLVNVLQLEDLSEGKKKKQKKEFARLGELVRKMLDIPQFSSRYVLFTHKGERISGFIKPNFLTVPHDAISLNFGANPIPNVILVGIYETTHSSDYTHLFNPNSFDCVSYEVLKAFAQLREEEGYIIRPLFIYYYIPLKD